MAYSSLLAHIKSLHFVALQVSRHATVCARTHRHTVGPDHDGDGGFGAVEVEECYRSDPPQVGVYDDEIVGEVRDAERSQHLQRLRAAATRAADRGSRDDLAYHRSLRRTKAARGVRLPMRHASSAVP